jgi:phosphoribosylformylglycinamidine (FGAM) synthase-like amidotransferase family enzyme
MKFGVVVFPGSNCDRDVQDALQNDLKHEVIMLWHKDKDLSMFSTDDCIILPGGFSYGDYLRCGAIARFSPMMQSVIDLEFVTGSRSYVNRIYFPAYCCVTRTSNLFVRMST